MRTLHAVCDNRILQDHSEGNSLHSQALQTLQERVREAEVALNREQDSYRQIQVSNLLRTHNNSSYSCNPVSFVYTLDSYKRLELLTSYQIDHILLFLY